DLALGDSSLEWSRPGAAAAALWATQRLLPLQRGGEFARGLERGREAALALYTKLKAGGALIPAFAPELDIVVFAPRAASISEISAPSRQVFAATAQQGLQLTVAQV